MGVLIGPNTLYYVIVRPKGKLREDFDFSDEKVRKPALLRPEMGERGTGDMATTVIAITNQKGGDGKTTTAAALLTGLHRLGAAPSIVLPTDPPFNPPTEGAAFAPVVGGAIHDRTTGMLFPAETGRSHRRDERARDRPASSFI